MPFSPRILSPIIILSALLAGFDSSPSARAVEAATVRVVVWDEQQPEQKQAYENFLGNAIADYLKGRPGFTVRSVAFSDPEHGLSADVLDHCDVLVWWSHFRTNPQITRPEARKIVDRIEAGKLSMITLHSAHWSEPFVQAMRDRATADALKGLSEEERKNAEITYVTPKRFAVPKRNAKLTPSVKKETGSDGKLHLEITLPGCIFPAYRADGKPSHVRTLMPDHPIAQGLAARWDIPQTEMYDEPFHVPTPGRGDFRGTLGPRRTLPQWLPVEPWQGQGLLPPPGTRDLSGLQAGIPAEGDRERRALAGQSAPA
ncbi:MAG TPA: ThuA domain-containing protein [Tepidisphaeraceae bacterium]